VNLRAREIDSIRTFVLSAAAEGHLAGRVLDYGCGRQPYRDIIERHGGDYLGFDRADFPASTTQGADHGPGNVLAYGYDAILCTQVLQYVRDPRATLRDFHRALWRGHGTLVLTYPTTWPEVEEEDMWRFTKAGMERLLSEAEFSVLRHDRRGVLLPPGNEQLAIGYGVVARA